MPVDHITIIGEILGEPAESMRNPVNAGYLCPYINSVCTKRGHFTEGPYPVCSIWRGPKKPQLVSICPNRLYEADIITDILEHAWPGEKPRNMQVAYEVNMKGFGNVDFVIADVNPVTNDVQNFVSVELQAVDISSSVQSAYTAVLNHRDLEKWPTYGFNWANVRKRFVSQLISKGFFHHHWGARMIAVLQEPLYAELLKYLNLEETLPTDNSNIIFMIYDYIPNTTGAGYSMMLQKVVGATHGSLVTGVLYRPTPDRRKFCERIIANIKKTQ